MEKPVEPTANQAFRELTRLANLGDEASAMKLRTVLDLTSGIWSTIGDLTWHAERAWLNLIADGNKLAEESIKRRVNQLKQDLASPQDGPLERLLIGMVEVRWLAAEYAETMAAKPSGNVELEKLRLRRAESAQKRFDRSVKTLLTARTMLTK